MRAAARAKAQRAVPLEYNLLLTATLCLLAFGAVMVYSASSARALLQGQGDGTAYLVRYLIYGGLGLIGMHVVARRGLDGVLQVTKPLLLFSFVCLLAVKVPGIGVTVNGARRWIGLPAWWRLSFWSPKRRARRPSPNSSRRMPRRS